MAGRRLPAFCRGGRTVAVATAATTTRVRKRVQRVAVGYHAASKLPPPAAAKASLGGCTDAPCAGGWCHSYGGGGADMVGAGGDGKKDGGGRRVMVVADGRAEAAGALQWALSQAVRRNDAVLLLAVVRPAAAASAGDGGESSCVKISRTRCYQQLDAMRSMCESARPEVKVEVCVMEAAGERAPAVVEAARRHGASLLVLGQRRRRRAVIARWLQLALWPAAAAKNKWRRRGGRSSTTVEYCIEHAPCVALGVRRRSSGGYLVSSKRHKDFWLLA
uniref:UspA domain-containing protein n=1 Tax=Oryza punctata TaxID=4537 RepID=A0A0E0KG46_ORYPU